MSLSIDRAQLQSYANIRGPRPIPRQGRRHGTTGGVERGLLPYQKQRSQQRLNHSAPASTTISTGLVSPAFETALWQALNVPKAPQQLARALWAMAIWFYRLRDCPLAGVNVTVMCKDAKIHFRHRSGPL